MITKNIFLTALLIISLFSCGEQAQSIQVSSKDQTATFNGWLEDWYQAKVERDPFLAASLGFENGQDRWGELSYTNYKAERDKLKKDLAFMKTSFDRAALDAVAQLSYDLFIDKAEMFFEKEKFFHHQYFVNPFTGWQNELPSILINKHEFRNPEDVNNYLSRLDKLPQVLGDLVQFLKDQEALGIIMPDSVIMSSIGQCQKIISQQPFTPEGASNLWADASRKLDSLQVRGLLTKAGRDSMATAIKDRLLNSVKPAYQGLIEQLQGQLEKSDSAIGLWKHPDGDAYYQYLVKHYTTTNLSPQEVHEIGLQQVARIHSEMKLIIDSISGKGTDLQSFFSELRMDTSQYFENTEKGKEIYLAATQKMIKEAGQVVPRYFDVLPKSSLIVKPFETFREKSAGIAAYENASLDGKRPGIYYINLAKLDILAKYELKPIAFHEAVPGHHFQISLAQENSSLPLFRKVVDYVAYTEGWGLYVEYLCGEMGLYKSRIERLGQLNTELRRACRLVIDTGIHYKRWSKQQAVDYFTRNTPNQESDCRGEVNRYISYPGQALSYMIGYLKLLELKELSRERLGSRFREGAFHNEVLKHGALPLSKLEQEVLKWLDAN